MRIILKNTSMKFNTYALKLNWTDSELKSSDGYLINSILNKNNGNVERSSSYTNIAVSPLIDITGATHIVVNAYNKKYSSSVAFFNSSVSETNAVYSIKGTSITDNNEEIVIDTETIQSAVELGADSIRIMLSMSRDDASVNIKQ